jgi:hypothetical protein
MDLVEIRWTGVDWISLAPDKGQVESTYESGNEALVSIKYSETIEWLHKLWPLE